MHLPWFLPHSWLRLHSNGAISQTKTNQNSCKNVACDHRDDPLEALLEIAFSRYGELPKLNNKPHFCPTGRFFCCFCRYGDAYDFYYTRITTLAMSNSLLQTHHLYHTCKISWVFFLMWMVKKAWAGLLQSYIVCSTRRECVLAFR